MVDEIEELVKEIEERVSMGEYPRELFDELKRKLEEAKLREVVG